MDKAATSRKMASPAIASRAERLIYRVAGLPVAVSAVFASASAEAIDPLRTAFAQRYWHPESAAEWSDLVAGLIAWPLVAVLASFWFTLRNGRIIRDRAGKSIWSQLGEQFRLYFSAGVLAPWYYIFSLHDGDGARRAKTYLQRFETKPCLFPLLKQKGGSPLNDKRRFSDYCADRQIRCVECLLYLNGSDVDAILPDRDLFVKLSKGRGGRGAERWDRVAPSTFEAPDGVRLAAGDLLTRLVQRSVRSPLIVQPRLKPHPGLADLTTGALPTTRIVTCLDEFGNPEVVAAMFRSSIGPNKTVDNMHAGGMGTLVDVATGAMSKASNIGSDARIGWFSAHPDTGAQIESRVIPLWQEAKELARSAHRHFDDRIVVGWDIAILEDGPIIVEGNGNPDLDILQRFMPIGFRRHRLGELMSYHLSSRTPKRRAGFA